MYLDVIINNRAIKIRSEASVLQACEEVGISIPRFCYHEHLSVAGNCRMCLVEIQKSPKPVVSCAMPISKGMVIFTETPLVKKAREAVLEFLLINHPLDCPICDQGGECDLQDETLQYGADRGRYYEFKRSVEDKECGPIIKTIMTRCIHCTRCIRFSSEIIGQDNIGSFGRGQDTEIGTYIQHFIKSELSGNLVDLCPVGALTSKPYGYKARNWELQRVETIDFFDGMCSDIIVHSRLLTTPQMRTRNMKIVTQDTILRILPKIDGLYTENWISDRTRYAFDGLRNVPKKNILKDTQWESQLYSIAHRIIGHGFLDLIHTKNKSDSFLNEDPINKARIGMLLGPLCDLQGIYFLSQFLKLLGHTDIQLNNNILKHNYDFSCYYTFNRSIDSLQKLEALFMIGTNTRYEASVLNTFIRKQQVQKSLTYFTLGAYSSLNLNQIHEGNSLRALIAYSENRIPSASFCYGSKNSSIFYSFQNNIFKNGFLLQNIIRFIGKKLFTKTEKGNRLGILHSNISSLNMAHLGISAGVRSPLYSAQHTDKQIATLFIIQMHDFKMQKWISSNSTHIKSSAKATSVASNIYTHTINLATNAIATTMQFDNNLQIQNLYEKNGFTFNVEGRLRKFNKAITSLKTSRSLESFLGVLSKFIVGTTTTWESIWGFEDEIPMKKYEEKIIPIFFFNPFQWKENENKGYLFLFAPHITNFYLNDIVSSNSPTMGECALFLDSSNQNFK